MRLLLIEDDTLLGDGIQAGLTQAHYAVDWITDGEAGEHALKVQTYNALRELIRTVRGSWHF
jgi:DNA-binding response OmpR family regulator